MNKVIFEPESSQDPNFLSLNKYVAHIILGLSSNYGKLTLREAIST